MKIREAIDQVDKLIANGFDRKWKICLLSEVDGLIWQRILSNYEGSTDSFTGYAEGVNEDTQLLVSAPHDSIYLLWLEAKIAYYSADLERYNNAYTMFNRAVETFSAHHHRTHMPKSKGGWKW